MNEGGTMRFLLNLLRSKHYLQILLRTFLDLYVVPSFVPMLGFTYSPSLRLLNFVHPYTTSHLSSLGLFCLHLRITGTVEFLLPCKGTHLKFCLIVVIRDFISFLNFFLEGTNGKIWSVNKRNTFSLIKFNRKWINTYQNEITTVFVYEGTL